MSVHPVLLPFSTTYLSEMIMEQECRSLHFYPEQAPKPESKF